MPCVADCGTLEIALLQQLGPLRDIRRDPPRLIFREQLGCRSPAGLFHASTINLVPPQRVQQIGQAIARLRARALVITSSLESGDP
jgi:hypothetical protein